MIELFKLFRLPHTQKIRKIIKILELLEAEAVTSDADAHTAAVFSCNTFYIDGLCTHIADMYPDDLDIAAAVKHYRILSRSGTVPCKDFRLLFNTLRHALYRQSGVQPSEWDLIAPGLHYGTTPATNKHSLPQTTVAEHAVAPPEAGLPHSLQESLLLKARSFYPELYVYAEDIRAPFNLGSIFRTAEAFGAEKLLLSNGCVSPEQPRAQRSAMGCTRFLPWEYRTLDSLPAHLPVFALETGGTSINSFVFPRAGIVMIGSEELGLSAEALKKVSDGIVSIPMKGIKASLNVAVAFGILMQCWTAYLDSLSAT